jgi:hypothetical protein
VLSNGRVFVFLSGVFVPFEIVPDAVKQVAQIFPHDPCDDAYAGSVDRRKSRPAHNRGRDSAGHFSRRDFDISENIQMGIDKADIDH